jgi:hypothetical protein
MRSYLVLAALTSLAASSQCLAHRLDEYLQAASVSVAKDRITVSMRLSPGVAVAPFVLDGIDLDRDGVISDLEQSAYASRLLRDLTLSLDGSPLALRVVSMRFPSMSLLRDGEGAMVIEYVADIPYAAGARRQVRFENSHLRQISVYLVNALVPEDPSLHVQAQTRTFDQSSYELTYSQVSRADGAITFLILGRYALLIAAALAALSRFVLANRHGQPKSELTR